MTFIRERRQNLAAMLGVMAYCMQEKKTYDPAAQRILVSGVNCVGANARQEFLATKRTYHKTDGMNFYQYVQSFSPQEPISPTQAHRLALEFAARAWPGHEVLVTTHCDAAHVHSHFVINSVSFENGYKLRQSPQTLRQLRALSDEVCRAHGFQILKPYENAGTKLSPREYRAAAKGKSWKSRLMATIGKAMEICGSKEEFLSHMRSQGYEVLWTDERKYITFTCPGGMKCRDNKLHYDKFLKENLEYELYLREQLTEQLDLAALGEAAGPEERRRGEVPPGDAVPAYERSGGPGPGYGVPAGGGGVQPDTAQHSDGRTPDESREGHYGVCLTGWEDARRKYFDRLLRRDEQALEKAQRAYRLHRAGGGLIGLGLRGLLEAGTLIRDDSEDEEERRKRMEAEENSDNLGAAIGLAAGIFSALAEEDDADAEEEAEEENQWLQML